ncbi:unnamed protein product [Withania somnifera]
MDSETPFTALAPPVFKGEGYHVWAARIEAHVEANDQWEAVEEDYEVPLLPANPTMAQIRNHKEKKTRKSKARATFFAAVSSEIFVWNFLKKEYEGDERIKEMRILNLIREFELQKIKDSVDNQKAQEYGRLMRSEGSVEGALPAKVQSNQGNKGKKVQLGTKPDFPPCKHCGKKRHPPFKCWRKPDQQCEKCQKIGHHQKICKNNTQQNSVAQVANHENEEQFFVATFYATSYSSDKWLIDGCCTS